MVIFLPMVHPEITFPESQDFIALILQSYPLNLLSLQFFDVKCATKLRVVPNINIHIFPSTAAAYLMVCI